MHHASCLNPPHVTNLASSSESLKQLMNQLVYLKIFLDKTGDKALIQFSNFILNCVKEEQGKIIYIYIILLCFEHLFIH